MDYFALLPIARYEEDNEGISILSITRQERIIFNKEKSEVVKKIISGPLPNDWEKDELITSIVDEIIDMGMGYIYERKVYVEEYKAKREIRMKGLLQGVPILEDVYIDLNGPRLQAEDELSTQKIISNKCKSCMSGIANKNILDWDKIIKSFNRLILLITKRYVIIGGDPFGRREELITILKKIRKEKGKEVDIVIHTNGMFINNIENINIIKEYKAKIVLSVFEKNNSVEDDEYITRIEKTMKNLRDNNIDFDSTYVGNEESTFREKIQEHGIVFTNEAHCYSKGDRIDFLTSKERSNMFLDEYIQNDEVKGCLYRRLTISAEGKYKVCPHMDDITETNSSDLDYIFENDLQSEYWDKSKKNYSGCSKCRYVNCCKNCILLDEGIKNGDMMLSDICDKRL